MKNNEIKKCCICGQEFVGYGNNPDGAAWKTQDGEIEFPEFKDGDRCRDVCDSMYVIPGRIYRLRLHRKEGENK